MTKFKLPKSFHYFVSYEAETVYPEGHCTCGDDYCRCTVIGGAKVTGVSYYSNCSEFVRTRLSKKDRKDKLTLLLYTRLWAILLREPEYEFEVVASPGYYGEEVTDVVLSPSSEIPKKVSLFNSLSVREKINYLLTLEYGYLLEEVREVKDWTLQKVRVKEIEAKPERLAQVQEEISAQSSYRRFYTVKEPWQRTPVFPGFVLLPSSSGGYRLVDGFHRYAEILKVHEDTPRKLTKVWSLVPAAL